MRKLILSGIHHHLLAGIFLLSVVTIAVHSQTQSQLSVYLPYADARSALKQFEEGLPPGLKGRDTRTAGDCLAQLGSATRR